MTLLETTMGQPFSGPASQSEFFFGDAFFHPEKKSVRELVHIGILLTRSNSTCKKATYLHFLHSFLPRQRNQDIHYRRQREQNRTI